MTIPGIENDPQALAENPDLAAALAHMEAIRREYSEYVATQNIVVWGGLAAVPGDELPTSTVTRFKWDEMGLAAKRTSKAGREVLERTGKATTEEREAWASAAKGTEKPATKSAAKGGDANKEGVS
jgi:hypothetical protein